MNVDLHRAMLDTAAEVSASGGTPEWAWATSGWPIDGRIVGGEVELHWGRPVVWMRDPFFAVEEWP